MQITFEGTSKPRIDKYLSQTTEFTRGQIQKLISQQHITINGKSIKQTYKLQDGDQIHITPPDTNHELKAIAHPLEIVFENQDIYIINKPAGISVHPSEQNPGEETLINWMLGNRMELSNPSDKLRPGIVHRLDKDTSGLLIIAKNNPAHQKLNQMMADRKIQKNYYAICFFEPMSKQGVIDAPIARDFTNRTKMTIENSSHARTAITEFTLLKSQKLEEHKLSLLDINLKTGRTHQIRVHLNSIGLPIVGDQKYGSNKLNRRFFPEIKRQALHAYKLQFDWNEETVCATCELPEEIKNLI